MKIDMYSKLITVCAVFTFSSTLHYEGVSGAKILISAIYGEGSHFLAASAIGESLLKRGHEVTFLISNAYDHRAKDPKYDKFSFEIFNHSVPAERVQRIMNAANHVAFQESNDQFSNLTKSIMELTGQSCKNVITDRALMRRLKAMDAIMMDISWPCGIYIKAALQKDREIPKDLKMIANSPTTLWSGFVSASGSPFNFAYMPETMTGFTNRMNFLQRLKNIVQSILIQASIDSSMLYSFRKMEREVGLQNIVDPFYGYTDFDLYLSNIHFSSDFPVPMVPNLISVGGLTAKPAGRLQNELEEFVQSSGDHGVIVFTLGTYLASITTIRPEIVTMFAEAFRRLPQKVIWQLKELPDWELPSNVKAMPWLPQNDLLGHPKTRVFMYQGGNNGFQEACYHGVPIVVIPLQGDQYDVAARIEARGLGKKIEKLELNADIIYDTLTEVINNPSYNEVADKVSAIYKDQPMSAPDRAAFWIEHVIKFGGAYMRSPANDLTFIQYHLIDVYAFLTAIVVVFLAVVYYTLKFCVSLCCRMIGRGSSGKSKTE
ncbi:UDP-glucuronosyltransferase 2C1-like isoform X1 [Lytechinus variegatus]|uniref:UDP-glucuronosyltransferase 2C1-like isoform X1 n=1 Tax=Lytechinus variegatus TaxID=7654 RepID=UPI001BB18D7C|nr:UDP-glucuronosyltransferase 2C1-like isoform X1 [Lytechinus variegatus]